MSQDRQIDICLSFAEEQRNYVRAVAELLKDRGITLYYDEYDRANSWGVDLYEHLDEVYRKRSKYCVIFISQEYARKVWTTFERRSAQARAVEESREYILPARFDDTEIPGIRPTIGYVDLRNTMPEELADLISRKLEITQSSLRSHPPEPRNVVPRSLEEQEDLIREKPTGWEYILFAGVLLQGKKAVEPKQRDHYLQYPEWRRTFNAHEAVAYIKGQLSAGQSLIDGIMKTLETRSQVWAFGAAGEPGNVENIIHLATRFVRTYEGFLDWAADIRGTRPPDFMTRYYDLHSTFLDSPIRQIETFIDEFVQLAQTIPESPENAHGGPAAMKLELVLSIEEDLANEINKEGLLVTRRMQDD